MINQCPDNVIITVSFFGFSHFVLTWEVNERYEGLDCILMGFYQPLSCDLHLMHYRLLDVHMI